MSSPVAFSVLLSQLQQRCNIENGISNITVPEQRGYLNEGFTDFWDLLVEARGHEHIRKASSFATVANQSDYPVPTDFHELISVDIQLSPNNFMPDVGPFMEHERNAYKLFPGLAGWFLWTPVRWRMKGSPAFGNVVTVTEKVISFVPLPQSAFTVGLNYIYAAPQFDTAGSQDTNVVDSINGWTAYVVWHAVATCKAKLKEDPSYALAKMADLRERIIRLAPQVASGDAERIRDVDADYGGLGWWGGS